MVSFVAAESTPGATSGFEAGGSAAGFWAAVVLVGLCLLVGATCRIVGRHDLAVISRHGHVVRVCGPGIVFHLPGVEALTMVSLRAHDLPLVVRASSRDAVTIRLIATATAHVNDARLSVGSGDPVLAAALAVEDALSQEVAGMNLIDLLPARADLENRLPEEVSRQMSPLGVGVAKLELAEIETVLSAHLLQVVREAQPPATAPRERLRTPESH